MPANDPHNTQHNCTISHMHTQAQVACAPYRGIKGSHRHAVTLNSVQYIQHAVPKPHAYSHSSRGYSFYGTASSPQWCVGVSSGVLGTWRGCGLSRHGLCHDVNPTRWELLPTFIRPVIYRPFRSTKIASHWRLATTFSGGDLW